MLSIDQLRQIMPALPLARGTTLLPFLDAAMTEFAIATPARMAAFLAQIAHESGELRFMEEIWGPTAAQVRYEPVTTLSAGLGNTEAGDGKRFKGRGPIQLTGRANYRRFGDLLGIDLIADPARASAPELAFRTAALFWSRNGLNELADQAGAPSFETITRRINGGLNGLSDRRRFYATACTVFGVVAPPAGAMRMAPMAPATENERFARGFEAIAAARPRRSRVPAAGSGPRPRASRRATGPTRTGAKGKSAAATAGTRKTGKSRTMKAKRSTERAAKPTAAAKTRVPPKAKTPTSRRAAKRR